MLASDNWKVSLKVMTRYYIPTKRFSHQRGIYSCTVSQSGLLSNVFCLSNVLYNKKALIFGGLLKRVM